MKIQPEMDTGMGRLCLSLAEFQQNQPREEFRSLDCGKGICLTDLCSPYHLPRESVTVGSPDDESEDAKEQMRTIGNVNYKLQ